MARSEGTRYPRGGSALWLGNEAGPTLLRAEFFGPSGPLGENLSVTPGSFLVAGQSVDLSAAGLASPISVIFSGSTHRSTSASTWTIVAPDPGAMQQDDVFVVWLSVRNGNANNNPATLGWTSMLLYSEEDGGGNGIVASTRVWARRITTNGQTISTANRTFAYFVNFTGSEAVIASIVLRGVRNTGSLSADIVGAAGDVTPTDSTASATLPSAARGGTGRLAIAFGHTEDNALGDPPAAWSQAIAPSVTTAGTVYSEIRYFQADGTTDQQARVPSPDVPTQLYAAAIIHAIAATAPAFSVDVTPGSYTLTGSAAETRATRLSAVTPASYAITGASAITLWRRRAEVTPGSYGVTGQPATTLWGRSVDTTAAAYAITGSPAELIYAPITPALTLDVTPGAYALTGATAGVRWGQLVDVTPAAFTISGQAVTFRRVYRAEVLPGAYTVAGAAATLLGPGDIAPEVTGDYQIIMRRRRR